MSHGEREHSALWGVIWINRAALWQRPQCAKWALFPEICPQRVEAWFLPCAGQGLADCSDSGAPAEPSGGTGRTYSLHAQWEKNKADKGEVTDLFWPPVVEWSVPTASLRGTKVELGHSARTGDLPMLIPRRLKIPVQTKMYLHLNTFLLTFLATLWHSPSCSAGSATSDRPRLEAFPALLTFPEEVLNLPGEPPAVSTSSSQNRWSKKPNELSVVKSCLAKYLLCLRLCKGECTCASECCYRDER